MNTGKSKTREQAEMMAKSRVNSFIAQYPRPNELKGLSQDAIYQKLYDVWGKKFIDDKINISLIEKQIKSRRLWSVIAILAIAGAIIWWNANQFGTITSALQSGNGNVSIWLPTIATVVVDVLYIWYFVKNIKSILVGSWNMAVKIKK